jgi:hypothetical protein
MVKDHTQDKEFIQKVLGYSHSTQPSMNFLLEYCADSTESIAWRKISELDFEKDVKHLQNWLRKTLTAQPPAEFIQAFWFGLTNPVLNDGETSCDLYVSGSIHFDTNDPTGAWTHLDPTFYLPKGCYAQSAILDRIYYMIHQYGVVDPGEYVLCLGYACLAVRAACSQIEKHLLYGFSGPRPIAVGFENGDLIHIERYLTDQ